MQSQNSKCRRFIYCAAKGKQTFLSQHWKAVLLFLNPPPVWKDHAMSFSPCAEAGPGETEKQGSNFKWKLIKTFRTKVGPPDSNLEVHSKDGRRANKSSLHIKSSANFVSGKQPFSNTKKKTTKREDSLSDCNTAVKKGAFSSSVLVCKPMEQTKATCKQLQPRESWTGRAPRISLSPVHLCCNVQSCSELNSSTSGELHHPLGEPRGLRSLQMEKRGMFFPIQIYSCYF